jgi:hypothetical protein
VPALPSGLSYVELTAGGAFSAARRSDGSVVVWGFAQYGLPNVPALPAGVTYVAVAAGGAHIMARRSDGSLVGWGYNHQSQCLPPPLPSGLTWVEVAAGSSHTLARRSDDAVFAFGSNEFDKCNVPALASGRSFVEVAGGTYHSVARYEIHCPAVSTYCTAKVNSLGCVPAIGSSGTPSATAGSGFVVECTNVLNNKVGLLFYGVSGSQSVPYQAGTLCVKWIIKRTPAVFSGGNPPPIDCSGRYSIDMNAFAVGALGGAPLSALTSAGTVVDCQWWGRDPGFAAPNGTTLSAGLEYSVCP